jgi:hypothetical protein
VPSWPSSWVKREISVDITLCLFRRLRKIAPAARRTSCRELPLVAGIATNFHISPRVEGLPDRSDPLIARQHRPTHVVTDVGNGIPRRFSEGHARGESVPVPGQAKILSLKICDHAIARAVAAGCGDFYGKFCQDCPELVCARRFVRMKCGKIGLPARRRFAGNAERQYVETNVAQTVTRPLSGIIGDDGTI